VYERLVRQELESAPDPAITKLSNELRGTTPPQSSVGSSVGALPTAAVVEENTGRAVVSQSASAVPRQVVPRAASRRNRMLVLAGAATWTRWRGSVAANASAADRSTILVTPFRVVGADSTLHEFGEGMVDLL